MGPEPLSEGGLRAEEAANLGGRPRLAVAINKLEAKGFESLLGPQPIFWVADKDAFGRFREIAPFWPQALEVDHGLVGHPRCAPLEPGQPPGARGVATRASPWPMDWGSPWVTPSPLRRV
jgi:hypothetical protein